MARASYDKAQLHELLYQGLETEIGGEEVYLAAIECAVNDDLRKEWNEYLEETREHQKVLLALFEQLGLDPEVRTPGREIVAHHDRALVEAMEMARDADDPAAAELVAAECVVLAETKDHLNWELVGYVAKKASGDVGKALMAAYEEVESQEDHHLYHTKGWTRELWLQSLGLAAVLPPPEEVRKVETAIGAARAESARDQMRKH